MPEVTDPALAEREAELSILSALAHGNGPNGQAVVVATLAALGRLDPEHATVYFQVVYEALREPMRATLEAILMQRQTDPTADLPPFMQKLRADWRAEGRTEGAREGRLEGARALQEVLLRLLARSDIVLTESERERITTCHDLATLEDWIDNVFGAKTASDVLSS